MDGTDATPRGSSPVGLERFETYHEIVQGSCWWQYGSRPTSTYTRSHGTERHRRSKRPEKKSVTQGSEVIHLGRGTMEEMLIIPQAEAPELVQKHSALLMEDGRLSHAVRLAARQERLLTDKTLPDDVAVERVKPVDRLLRRAVKKVRQLQTQPLTAEEEAQEGQELLTPALSKWCDAWCEPHNPMGHHQPPSTSPRQDVVVVVVVVFYLKYPLHRRTPLREARRHLCPLEKKKERPHPVYPFPSRPRN